MPLIYLTSVTHRLASRLGFPISWSTVKAASHVKEEIIAWSNRVKKPRPSARKQASVMLTNSEIGRLQQNKRELSDYARKAFSSLKK